MKRIDEQTLQRAHLLSLLVRTPDEQLSAFANRAAIDHALEETRVRAAKALVDAIGEALETNDDATWQRIARAERALSGEPPVTHAPAVPLPPKAAATDRSMESAVAPPAPASADAGWPVAPPRAASIPLTPAQPGSSPWAPQSASIEPAVDTEATIGIEALGRHTAEPPLPFQGTRGAPPSSTGAAEPHSGVGETAFMPALTDVEASLPFAVAAVAPMTPERYAALVAEEERTPPMHRASLYHRFGIEGTEERQRLDQEMGRFLRRDGAARAAFEQWLARYRGRP